MTFDFAIYKQRQLDEADLARLPVYEKIAVRMGAKPENFSFFAGMFLGLGCSAKVQDAWLEIAARHGATQRKEEI